MTGIVNSISKARSRWAARRGASALTYGIILGLVAIAGIGSVQIVGGGVEGLFEEVDETLPGNEGDGASAPGIPTLDGPLGGDGVISGSELLVLSGQADTGAEVTATATDQNGASVSDSDVANSPWSITLDLAPLADGEITVAIFAEQGGRRSGTRSESVIKDATAPTGASVQLGGIDSLINASQAPAVELILFDGAGTTADWQITSDVSGDPLTGSATVDASPSTIEAIAVDGFPDSTLTASVTLTDENGNVSAPLTDTAVLDQTFPVWDTAETLASVLPGDEVSVIVAATDASAVTYALSSGDSWIAVANDGTITGTVPEVAGEQSVTVTASDAAGNSVDRTFTITVRDEINPVWQTAESLSPILPEASLSVMVSATDINTPITYSRVGSHPWISVAGDGTLSGTAPSTPGTESVTVRATDAAGNFADRTFTVDLLDVVEPSWVTGADLGSIQADSSLSVSVVATDPSTPITYTKTGGAAWINVNGNTGALTGTAPSSPGSASVTIEAEDAAGNAVARTFTIQIEAPAASISGNFSGIQTFPSIAVTSNAVTLQITAGTVSASASSGFQLDVNGDNNFQTNRSDIGNGASLRLRTTSPSANGSRTGTLTVDGGEARSWTVTSTSDVAGANRSDIRVRDEAVGTPVAGNWVLRQSGISFTISANNGSISLYRDFCQSLGLSMPASSEDNDNCQSLMPTPSITVTDNCNMFSNGVNQMQWIDAWSGGRMITAEISEFTSFGNIFREHSCSAASSGSRYSTVCGSSTSGREFTVNVGDWVACAK